MKLTKRGETVIYSVFGTLGFIGLVVLSGIMETYL